MLLGVLNGGAHVRALASDPFALALAFVAAVLCFVGQAMMNKAFQFSRAGPGTVLRMISVPLAYLGGLFLDEVPRLSSLVGSATVVIATVYVGLNDIRKTERAD